MILSGKFVFFLALAAIGSWHFPAGLFIDAGIIGLYAYVKRKRGANAPGKGRAPAYPAGGDPATADLVKLVALSMIGKQGSGIDGSLAGRLGLGTGTGAPAPRGPMGATERAFRRSLVD